MAIEVTVQGTVQGVGFRQFVYRLASELGPVGDVRNDGGGGVFQNRRPTERVLHLLAQVGLCGFAGERIPVNDAGISYGHAVVAAARLGERGDG